MKKVFQVLVVILLILAFSLSLSVFASKIGQNSSTSLTKGPSQTSAGAIDSSTQPPMAIFTFTPEIPLPGETIVFDASASYAPAGSIVQYTWDFGDGNVTTVTGPTVTHSYPLDGNYTVELAVTDNNGQTGTAATVVQVQEDVNFRVCFYGTVVPAANVQVTVYYYNSTAYAPIPPRAGNPGVTTEYDNVTQPKEAMQYRNPAFTASILLNNATNLDFDIHPSCLVVFFKFQWGSQVAYWPNNTDTYYRYINGNAVVYNFKQGQKPYWDSTAGTYVIKASDIKSGESMECQPIIASVLWPPPVQNYNLTVRTDPSGITTIPGQGLYASGTNVTLTAPTYVNVSSSTRYRFNYWDFDGTSQGSGVNPITVFMNANHTATAHYVTQYSLNFSQTGLSPDATGTIVTVNGIPETLTQLPYTLWTDTGSSATYSYTSVVPSAVSGKQYRVNTVSGPASPIIVTDATTVTGNYVTQYLVTFAQTGLGSTANGTVVIVNGTPKTYLQLPYSFWVDSSSYVTYSYSSPASSSTAGKQFKLLGFTGQSSPATVAGPTSITGNYKTQYYLTVTSPYDSPSPLSGWFDSGSGISDSVTSPVSGGSGIQYVCTGWAGTGSVPASGSATSVTFTIGAPSTIIWDWKTQYQVAFDETGVGSDFAGTVVTIDSVNYGVSGLSVSFWWDQSSSHSFSFASPLIVNASEQYPWDSTSGLSTLQSGTLTITASGSVVGNYIVQNQVTFDQIGVSSDFSGTVVIIDSVSYSEVQLPVSFSWSIGSTHSFAYQSPLVVGASSKQYVWTNTTGLSSLQSGSITVTSYGSIIGNYKTQCYVTVTSPYDSPSPLSGWFDSGSGISGSVTSPVSGGSGIQYVCTGWAGTGSVPASGSATSVTFTITQPSTLTWKWKTQYQVTFDETGVGSDFTGTVVTVDSNAYTVSSLPVSFWWDSSSSHSFSLGSPLVVNASEQYNWVSTSGLTTIQSGSLNITGSGSVTGRYSTGIKYQVTFSQSGLSPDFTGTVVTIDGTNYGLSGGNILPVSFWWDSGSTHTFAFQSPLVVTVNSKQYVWTGTTGLSTLQSDTITVSTAGSVTGNYKTQYYLTLATNPSGVTSPSGAGWYDVGTNATVSTDAFVTITPGSSRYRFNGWTTFDISEISNYLAIPTTVLVDGAKTVTATYAVQYNVTFSQAGVGSDFTGTVVIIDGSNYTVTTLSVSFWWDNNTAHIFAFQSQMLAIPNAKAYGWTNTTGLSTSQTGTLTISAPGNVIGNYATQYYLTVTSPYDSPTPASGWFNAGTSMTASVTSPASGPTGTQYVCTGWSGTGSVPSSGSGTTTTFTITQASTVTWSWKTQYYLTVQTDPTGEATIPGQGWYDPSSTVTLDASTVAGWNFSNWDIDGTSQGSTNPIIVNMNATHTATAHYVQIPNTTLTVTISPMSVSTAVGNGVLFTSTVSAGTAPYGYQWYLNGGPVSGATSPNWTFVPPTPGVYYVYLKVTDAANSTAQSGIARVEVIPPSPVGGFSISMEKPTPLSYFGAYMGLVALFGTVLCLKKRKRK